MKNIFLIGFMGCGKSTVAAALAKDFGLEIVEMDQSLVEREGMSIPDIFSKYGETYFRDAETRLLIEIQTQENKVVSCGGGVVLREQNVEEMRKNGVIVLLVARPETILERVKENDDRPLLKGKKNIAYITEMLDARRPKYENAADITIQTDGKSVKDICDEIIEKVKTIGE